MRGTRPKLWQKKLLKEQGYIPENFLYITRTADNLKFRQKKTGTILDLKI